MEGIRGYNPDLIGPIDLRRFAFFEKDTFHREREKENAAKIRTEKAVREAHNDRNRSDNEVIEKQRPNKMPGPF